jgi:excisionase family DNA binding protein
MIDCKPKTLCPAEAGRVLGVSRNVIYRLIHEGAIPALRLGKKLRVPIAALEAMLQNPKPLKEAEDR